MSDVSVKVTADGSQLSAGLRNAEKSVNQFSNRTAGLSKTIAGVEGRFVSMGGKVSGVFSTLQANFGALLAGFAAISGISAMFDEVGRTSDLSQKFGVSAESIQRLGQAAEIGGTDVENLTKSLFKAQLAATEAAAGNEKYQQAFGALGLSAEEFMGLPIEEQLKAIAEGYAQNENKAAANAAAMTLMGKSASELIPLLASGGEAVGDALDMIGTYSTDTAEKMGAVEDRFKAIWTTFKAWSIDAIGVALDWIDKLGVGIAAAVAYVQNLSDGFTAAKEAYDMTLDAGLQDLEDQRAERSEKSNQVKASNITQIQEETKAEKEAEARQKAEDDKAKDAEKEAAAEEKRAQKESEAAVKAEEKKQQQLAEARVKAEKKAQYDSQLDSAGDALSTEKDKLAILERSPSLKSSSDSLRSIGGGFAKADYSNQAKQMTLLQQQIAVQKDIVDKQQKTIDAIKAANKTSAFDNGIGS